MKKIAIFGLPRSPASLAERAGSSQRHALGSASTARLWGRIGVSQRLEAEVDEVTAAPASSSATNTGSEATSSAASPTLACDRPTRLAGGDSRRSRNARGAAAGSIVFRIVSAVSWPGVTMTRIAIPRKAASSPTPKILGASALAPGEHQRLAQHRRQPGRPPPRAGDPQLQVQLRPRRTGRARPRGARDRGAAGSPWVRSRGPTRQPLRVELRSRARCSQRSPDASATSRQSSSTNRSPRLSGFNARRAVVAARPPAARAGRRAPRAWTSRVRAARARPEPLRVRSPALFAAEQLDIAILALPGPAGQALDELRVGQGIERLLDVVERAVRIEALDPLLQLARCLWAAEHQHRQQRDLRRDAAEGIVEQVPVLGDAAAGAAGQTHPAAPRQLVDRRADRRLVVVHDGLAVRRLVAGEP